MFNFHVVIAKTTDGTDGDVLDCWQRLDGARDTFEAARTTVQGFVDTECADGYWQLDCLTIWPSEDDEEQADAAADNTLSLVD